MAQILFCLHVVHVLSFNLWPKLVQPFSPGLCFKTQLNKPHWWLPEIDVHKHETNEKASPILDLCLLESTQVRTKLKFVQNVKNLPFIYPHHLCSQFSCEYFFYFLCSLFLSTVVFFRLWEKKLLQSKANQTKCYQMKKQNQLHNVAINGSVMDVGFDILNITSFKWITKRNFRTYEIKTTAKTLFRCGFIFLATNINLCPLEATASNPIGTSSCGFLHLVVMCICLISLKKMLCL